jgi:phosphatidylserine/phosphatidylglycerophosphate/cardiolipin synthase-like enzyme
MRLREIVRPLLKRAGVEEVQVELCTGSIGGMQADWLRAMLHCFSGGRYDALSSVGYPEDFRITYPTRPDVEATRERSQAGASQIGSHFNWNDAPRTVKDMFRHYRSKDQAPGERGERGNGCLFHQKLYMCFPKGTTDLKTLPIYLYIGSANFSKAAWGKAVPEIKKKQVGKEMERLADLCNFELGVVVRGEDLPSMLEQGSEWEDVVPHRRDTENFTGRDKPFNSESWVKK